MKHSKLITAAMSLAVAGLISVSAQAAGTTGYVVTDGSITKSLTGVPGDAANGKKVVINRKKGNCLACHEMPIPEQQFHGQTGAPLDGVGSNFTEAELRLRMVDAKQVNPDTMMPSFFTTNQHRVMKKFQGKTILSAQEIEDVIAYLKTIK